MYIDVLRTLRKSARREWQDSWWINICFLLHDNAPAQRSVLVKDFLVKNNATTLDDPSYFPDLTPGGFYLFPRMKSAVKGRSCRDVTVIIKHATDELKKLSQNGFQQCFQHLCSCWKKYIRSQSKKKLNIWNSASVSRRRMLAMVVLWSGDFKLYFHTSHITPLQLVIELRRLEWTCI